MVKPGGSKILMYRLRRTAENFRDSVKVGSSRRRRRPQVQKRLNTGYGRGPRLGVGDKCNGCLMQVLAETFVVAEEESPIFPERTTNRGSKLVPLKRWRGTLIEKVRRIEVVVAQKLEC